MYVLPTNGKQELSAYYYNSILGKTQSQCFPTCYPHTNTPIYNTRNYKKLDEKQVIFCSLKHLFHVYRVEVFFCAGMSNSRIPQDIKTFFFRSTFCEKYHPLSGLNFQPVREIKIATQTMKVRPSASNAHHFTTHKTNYARQCLLWPVAGLQSNTQTLSNII